MQTNTTRPTYLIRDSSALGDVTYEEPEPFFHYGRSPISSSLYYNPDNELSLPLDDDDEHFNERCTTRTYGVRPAIFTRNSSTISSASTSPSLYGAYPLPLPRTNTRSSWDSIDEEDEEVEDDSEEEGTEEEKSKRRRARKLVKRRLQSVSFKVGIKAFRARRRVREAFGR
ncbi:hypothetical protein CYLTODRAFT_423416 [Cylindrobasidium torrendii FP15055 ss-10]|uniref:Uncharacterized protein n=1 Tax=Cylindrobasidium torrendii FP15055 ss-10 TaxID=1314674 RepID=A0A0D7B7C7_9AGAR|nr:hypothetical protein CYLTODRAFT_423416 [Cylindrobasidium torrendii FP15055 ss-10]